MSILIEVAKKQFSNRSEAELRKEIGIIAFRIYQKGYFEPTGFVIWKDAVLEELGGTLVTKKDFDLSEIHLIEAEIDSELHGMDSRIINDLIIRIEGIWKFKSAHVRGYFSINNAYHWRKAYGDIDIDIYPSKEGEDLMTFVWSEKEVLVDGFFIQFLDIFDRLYKRDTDLHWLAFGSGFPTKDDVSTLRAVYYDSLWPFVTNIVSTFMLQNEWAPRSYRRKHITKQLFREEEFKKSIEDEMSKSRISKLEPHSIILIGEKLESFSKFYNKVSEDFLHPLFTELPPDGQINRIISRIARRQRKIDDNY